MRLPHVSRSTRGRFATAAFLTVAALASPATALQDADGANRTAPSKDAVDALIERGRVHLELDRLELAQADFDLAATMDGDSLRTRIWVLRGWIGAGRTNDALDATDALAKLHPGAPELDYLYGMAFAFKAQAAVAAGVTDPTVGMQFQDATHYLERATAADPQRYSDAHLALSLAAWYTQPPRLDVARRAGEEAVRRFPARPTAWYQLGRVAFSQYVALRGDPARAADARESWERTLSAFDEALALVGIPSDPTGVQLVGDARVQRANAFLWEDRIEEAAVEFGEAMGWNPASVDLARVSDQLGDSFVDALERGLAVRAQYKDADSPNSATLYWWLGHEQFERGVQELEAPALEAPDRESPGRESPGRESPGRESPESRAVELLAASEAAFQRCLELRPDFANCWFYLGHGRYASGDFRGAVSAFETYWSSDPAGFVAYVSSDPDYNVPRLEYLTGVAFRGGDLEGAAALAAACANGLEIVPSHWNNLGLFLRDRADLLKRSAEPADPAVLADLHERAYAAYARALELDPENPALLNDTAVMLDYYLNRELERALAMYEQAAVRAEVLLADPELGADERELFRVALRDARNNMRRLRARMAAASQPSARSEAESDAARVGTGASPTHDHFGD